MQWSIAEAKQKFAAMLRASATEPQRILNRGHVVAAVIDAPTFEAFQAWRRQQETASLAEAFTELRQLCTEEHYTLAIPARRDRGNAFAEAFDGDTLRHEHHFHPSS